MTIKPSRLASILLLVCAVGFAPAARADENAYAADATGFAQVAQPFLQEHCVK